MVRKRYSGKVNDKERTKLKLINAVGEVLKEKGYTGLSATNISKTAGVDRRLISLYFGSVEALIEAYLQDKDYWVAAAGSAPELLEHNKGEGTQQIIESLLLNYFEHVYENQEMQKILLWQLSEPSAIMDHLCEQRESFSQTFFKLSDEELAGQQKDLRAIAALLLGGICHIVLHAKVHKSFCCELDIDNPQDYSRIQKAIKQVLDWVYTSNPTITAT